MDSPTEPGLDTGCVRVAVRVRPLITRELLQGSRSCISTDGPCVTVGRDRRFTFDHAFGPTTQQDQVYTDVVAPLVESCFDGFNVTVLAYGQTGSGKTYTMGTGECSQEEQLGMAPRAIRHLFQGIAARKQQAAFYVRAQFLEIYNEDVKDLLLPPAEQAVRWVSRDQAHTAGGNSGGITLRDAGDGTIMVIGASEEPAECAQDLLELLERGMAARATSSTCANEQSSRSHAILTIIVEQHMLLNASLDSTSSSGGSCMGDSSGRGAASSDGLLSSGGGLAAAGEIRTAKLHLVDLAGSERTKQLRSSSHEARFRETVNINQGLLALGNVISALGDERRRGSHVPYRESKLTRLLQDSLGGNSRTAMIACVSPADEVLEETLNTLKYANRARNIRNKPVINRAVPPSPLSPLHGAVAEVQLVVLQQLASQLPDNSLTRSLPLAELLALDGADPAACLEVLTRMRSALSVGGAGTGSSTGSLEVRMGLDGHPLPSDGGTGTGSHGGSNGEDISGLLGGCSRAIAGILQGLAEMEAQGHIKREAREHILRSLDTSTLALLPAVRSMGPSGAPLSAPGGPQVPALGSAVSPAASSSALPVKGPPMMAEAGSASTERERVLEERVRSLESELASCRLQLQEAKEDLERDEIIFADKMKELQDAHEEAEETRRRLGEVEERHAKQVEELQQQLAAAQQQAHQLQRQQQQGIGMPLGPGSGVSGRVNGVSGRVNGVSGRSGIRPPSGSGMAPGQRQRPESNASAAATGAEGEAAGTAAPAVDGSEGGDEEGERGRAEDEVLYDEELLSYISETDYIEQPGGREVLENDAALREELAEALRKKAVAEEQQAAVERAALAQRSSFDSDRSSMQERLEALTAQIGTKQKLLEAAQEAEREARELAEKWQERAQELEAAIEAREAALARLRSELAALEGGPVRSSEERSTLRQQYEQRIAAVVAQVSSLQCQLKRHSAVSSSVIGGARRDRQQPSAAAMEAELARLRSQQADLRKQLSDRVSRYERDSAARLKELAGLRREASAARSRMQALEAENRAQRLLLRDKQREVTAAQQRLRESQRASAAFGGGGGLRRSVSPGPRRSVSPGPRRSSSPGGRGYTGRGGAGVRGSVEALTASAPLDLRSSNGGGSGSRQSAQTRPAEGHLGSAALPSSCPPAAPPERLQGPDVPDLAVIPKQDPQLPQQQQQQPPQPPQAQRWPQEEPQRLLPEQQQELRGWAEALLAAVAEAAGVTARCEVLAARQAELRHRRELLLREQAQLDLRAQRRRDALAAAVAACDAELAELVGRIPSPGYDTPPASAPSTPRDPAGAAAVDGSQGADGGRGGAAAGRARSGGGGFGGSRALLSDEWVALQQRIADVSHGKAELEGRLRGNKLLDEREQEVMDSLDDQLDDLETQLSYVAGELAERRCALATLQRRRQQLSALGEGMSAAGLRLALGVAADAVEQRAFQVRQLEAALAASEAGAARREAALQVRLRESLVSLSAHLESLEAASPGSSASLKSSELRTLLGVYLDMDTGREPGPAPGRAHAPEPPHARQHRAHQPAATGTAARTSDVDGAAGPEAAAPPSDGGTQPQHDAEGNTASGSSTLGAHQGAADSELNAEGSDVAVAAEPESVASSLEALPRLPPCSGSVCLGPGGWSKQRNPERGNNQTQQHLACGDEDGVDLSLQALPTRPLATAARAPPAGVPPRPQERSGGLRHSWDGEQDASQAAAASREVPPQPQPSAQRWPKRSATPPPSGILRRAGSFDSVGSSGSGPLSAKRVTWCAALTSDPEVGAGDSAAVPQQAQSGTALGPGFSGRGRERSILDRAPGASQPCPQGLTPSFRGGAASDPGDVGDWRGENVMATGSSDGGGRGHAGGGPAEGAAAWRSGCDSAEPVSAAPSLPVSSQPHVPTSSVDRETDDTAEAGDTVRFLDSRSGSGCRGSIGGSGGAKPDVRSHNPWHSSRMEPHGTLSKPHGTGLGSADATGTGALPPNVRPASEGWPCRPKPAPLICTGANDDNDVLQLQDSDTLTISDESSTLNLNHQSSEAVLPPPPAVQRPAQSRTEDPERDSRKDDQPPHQQQQAMWASRVKPAPVERLNAVEGIGDAPTREDVRRDLREPASGRDGPTARFDMATSQARAPRLSPEDAELEEQVRMLEQAVAAAHSQVQHQVRGAGAGTPASLATAQRGAALALVGATPGRGGRVLQRPAGLQPSSDAAPSAGDAGWARRSAEGASDRGHPLRQPGERAARSGEGAGLQGSALPAPARSTSPTLQLHYGRPQRGTAGPGPASGPGPFTNPAPAVGALADMLMPYKAHLRSSGSASYGAGGGGGVIAGRSGTPDARRHAAAPVRAGFASPQVNLPLQPHELHQQQQQQRPAVPGAWLTSSDDIKPAAARQLYPPQQPQQQQQQPWRQSGAGRAHGGGILPGRSSVEERQLVMLREARQRGFVA